MSRWRWARDRWLSIGGTILKYDKLEHFLIYFFGAFSVLSFFKRDSFCFIIRCRPALRNQRRLPAHKKYGWWGGEGFSWKDLAANTVGIVLGLTLRYLLIVISDQ